LTQQNYRDAWLTKVNYSCTALVFTSMGC